MPIVAAAEADAWMNNFFSANLTDDEVLVVCAKDDMFACDFLAKPLPMMTWLIEQPDSTEGEVDVDASSFQIDRDSDCTVLS